MISATLPPLDANTTRLTVWIQRPCNAIILDPPALLAVDTTAVAAVEGHVQVVTAVGRDKRPLAVVLDLDSHVNVECLVIAHVERRRKVVEEAAAQHAHLFQLPTEAVDGIVDLYVVGLGAFVVAMDYVLHWRRHGNRLFYRRRRGGLCRGAGGGRGDGTEDALVFGILLLGILVVAREDGLPPAVAIVPVAGVARRVVVGARGDLR